MSKREKDKVLKKKKLLEKKLHLQGAIARNNCTCDVDDDVILELTSAVQQV